MNDNPKFKSGDVVVLKSGGIPMTVETSFESKDGTTFITHVAWVDGKTSKKESYFQDALEPFEDDDDPLFS